MPETKNWRQRWQFLGIPITFLALGWSMWLLWDAGPTITSSWHNIKISGVFFVLIGSLASAYLTFEIFYLLFNELSPNTYHKKQLANLYFVGQLTKHLPGRIWSIAYQAAMGEKASLGQWMTVNGFFIVLSIWFALWISGVVLALAWSFFSAFFIFLLGANIFYIIWSKSTLNILINILSKFNARIFNQVLLGFLYYSKTDSSVKGRIFTLFLLSWLIYLGCWTGYSWAWPGLSPIDAVWLCAFYTLAWFAGYISLITPSGLGVRELVFIALAKDFPPDIITGIAISGRIILLLVDLIFGLFFIKTLRGRV